MSEKVSLQFFGATVASLEELVPAAVADVLAWPGAFTATEEDWPETRPGCCMQISREEWAKLRRRRLDNGTKLALTYVMIYMFKTMRFVSPGDCCLLGRAIVLAMSSLP